MRFRMIAMACCALGASAVGQTSTYLAVGDSLGFGFQSGLVPSNGDRGYVSLVADAIASLTGDRPNVLNTSIPTETSTSFFAGGNFGEILNTNYAAFGVTGQANALNAAFGAQAAGEISIDYVTIHLGVNDLLSIADDDFLSLSTSAQLAAASAQIEQTMSNVGGVLTALTSNAPWAEIRVVGYYNPFALFLSDPGADPTGGGGVALASLSDPITLELNAALAELSGRFGVTFVDVFDAFDGREGELTLIEELLFGSPNIHPNDAGYAVLADRIVGVPSPGALVLLAAGGLMAARRRRAAWGVNSSGAIVRVSRAAGA